MSLPAQQFVMLHDSLSPAKRFWVISGRKLSMPIIVAPMSQQRMADDEGELAVARAVAKEVTAMVSQPIKLLSCQVLYTLTLVAHANQCCLMQKNILYHCSNIITMVCSACGLG